MQLEACGIAPASWKRLPISSVCVRFASGGTPSRKVPAYFDGGTIPWVKTQELTDCVLSDTDEHITEDAVKNSSAKVLPANTVLMAMYGATVGQLGVLARPMACNQACAAMVVDAAAHDYRFLYYQLLSVRPQIKSLSTGAAQQNLSGAQIKQFVLPFPSLAEQTGIAGTLWMIDQRIALLRETNATLEAIAQALFKSWFVDFDPVRAKQQGLGPAGMDEATAALFPSGFEDSEQGPVPEGWKLTPFGELLGHSLGGDWGAEMADEKNDTRVAIIRGTDIPDFRRGTASRVPIRYTNAKKLAGRRLKAGDIVLEVSGGSKDQPTGRALYVSSELLAKFDCPVEPASFCRLLRPSSNALGLLLSQHLAFIYDQGKTWEYQNQSTGIANFQTTHFLEIELVAVPPPAILAVFADVVQPLLRRTQLSQIGELAALRDALLPRLISGQLRLPEAEAETLSALA